MKPKLEALRIAEVKLEDAQKELEAAESKLQDCQVMCTVESLLCQYLFNRVPYRRPVGCEVAPGYESMTWV